MYGEGGGKVWGEQSAAAAAALAAAGAKPYEPLVQGPPGSRIFLGGLAPSTTVPAVMAAFRKFGEIIEPPVLRGTFGFVQYNSAESAMLAVREMNLVMFKGAKISTFETF